jgi:hypothetical protein
MVCSDGRCSACDLDDECGEGELCCDGACSEVECCDAEECAGGEGCVDGECRTCGADEHCRTDEVCCLDLCRAPDSFADDVDNCGGCELSCEVAHGVPGCLDGTCTVTDCDEGWDDWNSNASDGCEGRLTEIALIHTSDGTVTTGDVERVREVMALRGDVKVMYDDWVLYCTATWNQAGIASCQVWYPVTQSEDGGEWLPSNPPDWWFSVLNSTGLLDHIRYRMDSHSATWDTTTRADVTWFARDWRTEVFAHDDEGTAVRGERSDLIEAVENGTPASPWSQRPPTLVVTGEGEQVGALNPWHISASYTGLNEVVIQSDAYHFLQWHNTTGYHHMSRWSVGAHTNRGQTVLQTATSWWVEPGWDELYANDSDGSPLGGDLDELIAALLAGAELRVEADDGVFHDCTSAVINGDQVNCQVRDATGWTLSGDNVVHSLPDVYRNFRYVRSNGEVHTENYSIGSSSRLLNETETMPVRWFVNQTGWERVLATDEGGEVDLGSIDSLIDAITSGADIRAVLIWSEDSISLNACHALRFDRAGERAACVNFSPSIERPAGATGYWYINVINTDGVVRDQRINYGTTTNAGTSTQRPARIEWFVRP